MGRRYARVSGDYNPIHLSNITAKLFGFDQAIIHGMWSKARCLAALQDQLPEAGYRVIVNFQKPLFLPSNVLFYSDKESENTSFSLFSESGQYAHLDGLITGDLHNV
jgi:acyl dehydratase